MTPVSRNSPLQAGAILTGGSRTVTDAEISFLPLLMGVSSPLFHDEEQAKSGVLGGRVLYGPAVLGIAIGLTEQILGDVVIGLLGITDVRFHTPVRVLDTLTATLRVRDVRERESGEQAVLTADDQVQNQDGTVVLSFTRAVLIRSSQST